MKFFLDVARDPWYKAVMPRYDREIAILEGAQGGSRHAINHAIPRAGRGDRRRGGGVQRALPPHPAGLARRHAHRAFRIDLRLHLARGGRLPHPERRHQHGRVAGLHHPPLPRARSAHRPVLRAAPRRRAHPRHGPRPPRLPEGRTRQASLHGARHRDRGAGGGRAALADHPHRRGARRAPRSSRRPPRPLRHHPGVCEGRADAGRGDRAAQPGARASSPAPAGVGTW